MVLANINFWKTIFKWKFDKIIELSEADIDE
jgi:hypothetical protein